MKADLVALAAMLALLALSCESSDEGERSLGTRDVPDQEFHDFKTTESDSGLVKWSLVAPVARIYNSRNLLVTDNPRIEFFSRLGELASVLVADKGEYNQATHDLTALGNVVVTSQEGYRLETESLVWVEELDEIHSEDFIRFTREDDIITGYGLRSDPELKNVVILRDVKAYLRDEEGRLKEEAAGERRPEEE